MAVITLELSEDSQTTLRSIVESVDQITATQQEIGAVPIFLGDISDKVIPDLAEEIQRSWRLRSAGSSCSIDLRSVILFRDEGRLCCAVACPEWFLEFRELVEQRVAATVEDIAVNQIPMVRWMEFPVGRLRDQSLMTDRSLVTEKPVAELFQAAAKRTRLQFDRVRVAGQQKAVTVSL